MSRQASPASVGHARAVAEQAEALIAEGDLDEGMPLLASALDEDPGCAEALECLSIVAVETPDAWAEVLFARARAAVVAASTPAETRRALWFELCNAAFFDRRPLVREIAARADLAGGGDAALRASVGALRFELGDVAEGMALLGSTHDPLALFHRARIAFASGERAEPKDWLDEITDEGPAGFLRELGIVGLSLDARDAATRSAGKDLITRAEQSEDPLGPHIYSELLFFKLRLALGDGKPGDAAWAAEQLGMPPSAHDPGVMLRARALVGPLYLLRDSAA